MAPAKALPIVAHGMPATDQSVIALDDRGGVLHATLRSPPANALSPQLVGALASLVDSFVNGSAKVLVLSSEVPGFFAAGADIKHVATLDVERFADYRDAAREPMERLAACRRPSIAVIEGKAIGGGLEMAMACTLRFASPAARLGLPRCCSA